MIPSDRCRPTLVHDKKNTVYAILDSSEEQLEFSAAAAPHLIKMADCAFLAVDTYCVVKNTIIEDHEERRGNHQILFPEDEVDSSNIKAIMDFLAVVQVTNVYKFEIYQPFGFNGKFAMVSVLAAIWQLILVHEMENAADMESVGLEDFVDDTFKKNNMDTTDLLAAIKATMDQNSNNVHFIYHDKMEKEEDVERPAKKAKLEEPKKVEDKSVFNVSWLRKKYEFVYMKSKVHGDHESRYQSRGSAELAGRLWDAIEAEVESMAEDAPEDLHGLKDFFSAYFYSRNSGRREATVESTVESVLAGLEEEEQPVSDSHPCGTLLLFDKFSTPNIQEVLEKIATHFHSFVQGQEMDVTFNILNEPIHAAALENAEAEEYGIQEELKFNFKLEVEKEEQEWETGKTVQQAFTGDVTKELDAPESSAHEDHDASYDEGPEYGAGNFEDEHPEVAGPSESKPTTEVDDLDETFDEE